MVAVRVWKHTFCYSLQTKSSLLFSVWHSLLPSSHPCIFLIYEMSSALTHFPRRTLGVFPWVWNSLSDVVQTLSSSQSPGQRAKTTVTNHYIFFCVGPLLDVFCGVNSQVHNRCQGSYGILLTLCGTDPGPATALTVSYHFIFLISVMDLWRIGPAHLHKWIKSHTIRWLVGCYRSLWYCWL